MSIKNWDDLIYQYDVTIRRLGKVSFHLKMRLTGNTRPSSYPYISGDSFRVLANHIHEDGQTFEPTFVKTGDIIFCSQETLLDYFTSIHPKIINKYILICHNGDVTIDEKIVNLVDDKIAHFFAQDLIVEHPRITPIPIGLENLHFYIAGVTPFLKKLQRQIKRKRPVRKNRIFFNFSISTNPPERGPAREYFLKHPLMDTAVRFMTPRRHSRVLSTYKFVASPPGHAIESCRTWEAMYLGTVPIVKDFVAMNYFKSLGLPMWIVQDWAELEGLTSESLANLYKDFINKANYEALYMDFWINKIRDTQNQVRTNNS
jgi:hypothetical protein